jgi:hypothetical protein
MYQPHWVSLNEPDEFGFEGGEVAGLELDELSAAPQVNLKPLDAGFDFIAGAGVPGLEGRVQRGLAEGAEVGATASSICSGLSLRGRFLAGPSLHTLGHEPA